MTNGKRDFIRRFGDGAGRMARRGRGTINRAINKSEDWAGYLLRFLLTIVLFVPIVVLHALYFWQFRVWSNSLKRYTVLAIIAYLLASTSASDAKSPAETSKDGLGVKAAVQDWTIYCLVGEKVMCSECKGPCSKMKFSERDGRGMMVGDHFYVAAYALASSVRMTHTIRTRCAGRGELCGLLNPAATGQETAHLKIEYLSRHDDVHAVATHTIARTSHISKDRRRAKRDAVPQSWFDGCVLYPELVFLPEKCKTFPPFRKTRMLGDSSAACSCPSVNDGTPQCFSTSNKPQFPSADDYVHEVTEGGVWFYCLSPKSADVVDDIIDEDELGHHIGVVTSNDQRHSTGAKIHEYTDWMRSPRKVLGILIIGSLLYYTLGYYGLALLGFYALQSAWACDSIVEYGLLKTDTGSEFVLALSPGECVTGEISTHQVLFRMTHTDVSGTSALVERVPLAYTANATTDYKCPKMWSGIPLDCNALPPFKDDWCSEENSHLCGSQLRPATLFGDGCIVAGPVRICTLVNLVAMPDAIDVYTITQPNVVVSIDVTSLGKNTTVDVPVGVATRIRHETLGDIEFNCRTRQNRIPGYLYVQYDDKHSPPQTTVCGHHEKLSSVILSPYRQSLTGPLVDSEKAIHWSDTDCDVDTGCAYTLVNSFGGLYANLRKDLDCYDARVNITSDGLKRPISVNMNEYVTCMVNVRGTVDPGKAQHLCKSFEVERVETHDLDGTKVLSAKVSGGIPGPCLAHFVRPAGCQFSDTAFPADGTAHQVYYQCHGDAVLNLGDRAITLKGDGFFRGYIRQVRDLWHQGTAVLEHRTEGIFGFGDTFTGFFTSGYCWFHRLFETWFHISDRIVVPSMVLIVVFALTGNITIAGFAAVFALYFMPTCAGQVNIKLRGDCSAAPGSQFWNGEPLPEGTSVSGGWFYSGQCAVLDRVPRTDEVVRTSDCPGECLNDPTCNIYWYVGDECGIVRNFTFTNYNQVLQNKKGATVCTRRVFRCDAGLRLHGHTGTISPGKNQDGSALPKFRGVYETFIIMSAGMLEISGELMPVRATSNQFVMMNREASARSCPRSSVIWEYDNSFSSCFYGGPCHDMVPNSMYHYDCTFRCDPACVNGHCTAGNKCQCFDGWKGDRCDQYDCPCVHGTCDVHARKRRAVDQVSHVRAKRATYVDFVIPSPTSSDHTTGRCFEGFYWRQDIKGYAEVKHNGNPKEDCDRICDSTKGCFYWMFSPSKPDVCMLHSLGGYNNGNHYENMFIRDSNAYGCAMRQYACDGNSRFRGSYLGEGYVDKGDYVQCLFSALPVTKDYCMMGTYYDGKKWCRSVTERENANQWVTSVGDLKGYTACYFLGEPLCPDTFENEKDRLCSLSLPENTEYDYSSQSVYDGEVTLSCAPGYTGDYGQEFTASCVVTDGVAKWDKDGATLPASVCATRITTPKLTTPARPAHTCVCDSGWGGQLCDQPKCTPDCVNGDCTNDGGGAVCACRTGWTGATCEEPVCDSCLNGGVCVAPNTCKCGASDVHFPAADYVSARTVTVLWSGDDCSRAENCEWCFNNATCDPVTRSCVCTPERVGKYCQIYNCDGCEHGSCNDVEYCICDAGWEGEHCGTPLCPNCVNGNCVVKNDQPFCECADGWVGENCEDVSCDGCVHGYCQGTDFCICEPGWKGHLCATSVCEPQCVHGKCEEGICKCIDGWIGEACDGLDCGKCTNGACQSGYCVCDPGYIGAFCHLRTCPNCHGYPCKDGECVCPDGDCGPPCPHCVHGRCERGVCMCDPEYSGITCELKRPSCSYGWPECTWRCEYCPMSHSYLAGSQVARCPFYYTSGLLCESSHESDLERCPFLGGAGCYAARFALQEYRKY